MIKEIQQISNKMIILNSQVYNAILSKEDLNLLKNALTNIQSIQNDINFLLDKTSFIASTEIKSSKILINIHQLLSQLGIEINTIYTLMDKFVCNFREEWHIIHQNQA